MAKLKITQEQYNKIVLHEQVSRLNLLTETTHEAILGIAMLAGMKLTGTNDIMAKKALEDEKTLGIIKNTLEDDSKTKELVKKLEEKGMSDVNNFLSKHADSIIKNYNVHSKTNKLDFLAKTNLTDLNGK
jgi:hypothetical protein